MKIDWLSAETFVVLRSGNVFLEKLGTAPVKLTSDERFTFGVEGFDVSADKKWLVLRNSSYVSVQPISRSGPSAILNLRSALLDVKWHPLANDLIVALSHTTLFVVSVNFSSATGISLHCDRIALAASCVAFSFGCHSPKSALGADLCGDGHSHSTKVTTRAMVKGFAQFAVYCVSQSGAILVICPIVAHGFVVSDLEFEALHLALDGTNETQAEVSRQWLRQCWRQSGCTRVYDHSSALSLLASALLPSGASLLTVHCDDATPVLPSHLAQCLGVECVDFEQIAPFVFGHQIEEMSATEQMQSVEFPILARFWSDGTLDVICSWQPPVAVWSMEMLGGAHVEGIAAALIERVFGSSERQSAVGRLIQSGDTLLMAESCKSCDAGAACNRLTAFHLHWLHLVQSALGSDHLEQLLRSDECRVATLCATLKSQLSPISDWCVTFVNDIYAIDATDAIHSLVPISLTDSLEVSFTAKTSAKKQLDAAVMEESKSEAFKEYSVVRGSADAVVLDVTPLRRRVPDLQSALQKMKASFDSLDTDALDLQSAKSLNAFLSLVRDASLEVTGKLKQAYEVMFDSEDWMVHCSEVMLPPLVCKLRKQVEAVKANARAMSARQSQLRRTNEKLHSRLQRLKQAWRSGAAAVGRIESGEEKELSLWMTAANEECAAMSQSLDSMGSTAAVVRRIQSLDASDVASAELSKVAQEIDTGLALQLQNDLRNLQSAISQLNSNASCVDDRLRACV